MSTVTVSTQTAPPEYPPLGFMKMPADFRYRHVLEKGKPRHDKYSRFRIRHPEMPCSRRAKIFAPFDALKGFNEAISSKNINYTDRPVLSAYRKNLLNRKLSELQKTILLRRTAGKTGIDVSVTYFELCTDRENAAYGIRGLIKTVTGCCRRIDAEVSRCIELDGLTISFEDLLDVDSV